VTALAERAGSLVTQAEARFAEQQRLADLERRNAALLARCEDLRMRQIEANFGFSPVNLTEQIEEDYAEAFREYGIDLEDPDLPAAMEKLRDSGIAQEAALALDDWASVRRRTYGFDSYEVEAVTALAFDLDPDPLRTRMREALLSRDEAELLDLARNEDLASAPPSTFWVLSQGLVWMKRDAEVAEVVRTGVSVHPDDFLLNLRLGELYLTEEQNIAAIPPLAAARSLRPGNGAVYALLGDALSDLGDHPAAARSYEQVLERRPDYIRIWRFVGWSALLAGDYEVALTAYDKVAELFPSDPVWAAEGRLARVLAGRLPLDALLEPVLAREFGYEPFWGAVAAACHPDPQQRDPARALEALALPTSDDLGTGSWGVSAFARLQLGDVDGAQADLERGDQLTEGRSRNWNAWYALLWAWVHHERGDHERARAYRVLAEDILEDILYDGEQPWSGSIVLSVVHEVRQRLGG
jgi:tetratricopeptide (TPR) repeat protein